MRRTGRSRIRLYTGHQLATNIAWYRRRGYVQESVEDLGDRVIANLIKHL